MPLTRTAISSDRPLKYPFAADAHLHAPPDAGLDKFKALQKILGLTRAVLVNASCHGVNNDPIIDAIAQSSGAYRGVANIDGDFRRESDRETELAGHPRLPLQLREASRRRARTWTSSTLVVNRIKAFKWRVVLHFDAIDLVTHEKLLDSLPVPYIIDHMGRVPTKDGLDQKPFKILLEFAKRDNCWIKVCGAERISSRRPAVHRRNTVRDKH